MTVVLCLRKGLGEKIFYARMWKKTASVREAKVEIE